MKTTRRAFLAFLATVAPAGGLVYFTKGRMRRAALDAQDLLDLDDLHVVSGETGALAPSTMEALWATAEAVIGQPVERSHYERFFAWHARELPGYAALYREFEGALAADRSAHGGRPFAACDFVERRATIDRVVPIVDFDRLSYRARFFFSHGVRLSFAFQKHVLSEILGLFGNTDAWVLVGYESWPGTPEGLERYRDPPR